MPWDLILLGIVIPLGLLTAWAVVLSGYSQDEGGSDNGE
jgi:hypothetical protein